MEALLLISFTVSSFLTVYIVFGMFYLLWWKPKSLERQLKQQGIKGTSYRFLFGDMKDYARYSKLASSKSMDVSHCIVPRVLPFVKEMVKTYGKVAFYWHGTMPTLVIMDPKLMKEILNNKLDNIQKPPRNPHARILTKGLSTMDGEKWGKHRKLITPAFHTERLKEMLPAFLTSSSELIQQWKNRIGHERSCEFDVWPDIQNFVANVISRTVFGTSSEEGKKIFQLQHEQSILVNEAVQSLYLPGFRFIPTKKNKRRLNLEKEIVGKLKDVIKRKISSMGTRANDLLGMLLQHNSSRAGNEGLSIDEVIEECKLFYFAGKNPSANSLTWAIILLAMHPNWQEKAREEVLRICGKNPPSLENLNQFKTVTMILYEVLRLYPASVRQFRYTVKKTKIGEKTIPGGVQLMLPSLLIHHDLEIWGEDAEEFKPERFSSGISKSSKEQVAFFPFGWGQRICPGQDLAMIEAKMALAMILQSFSFQLSPSYIHAPHSVITLQPQYGAQIILTGL